MINLALAKINGILWLVILAILEYIHMCISFLLRSKLQFIHQVAVGHVPETLYSVTPCILQT